MHLDKLTQRVRRSRMGGSNQSTCPPPVTAAKSKGKSNPIRSHEVTSRGEVDFHDDLAGVKCCVDSATFFDEYHKWRPKMTDDLTLSGNDGSGGHASVTLVPYVDNQGELQVTMTVTKASMGQTISDLDILAHFP